MASRDAVLLDLWFNSDAALLDLWFNNDAVHRSKSEVNVIWVGLASSVHQRLFILSYSPSPQSSSPTDMLTACGYFSVVSALYIVDQTPLSRLPKL